MRYSLLAIYFVCAFSGISGQSGLPTVFGPQQWCLCQCGVNPTEVTTVSSVTDIPDTTPMIVAPTDPPTTTLDPVEVDPPETTLDPVIVVPTDVPTTTPLVITEAPGTTTTAPATTRRPKPKPCKRPRNPWGPRPKPRPRFPPRRRRFGPRRRNRRRLSGKKNNRKG